MSQKLKFSSSEEALQHLANVTGRKVMVATNEDKRVFVLPRLGKKLTTTRGYMLALVRWFMNGHKTIFVSHDDTEGTFIDPRSPKTNTYVVLADSVDEAKRLASSELRTRENVKEIVDSLKQANPNDLLVE